MERLKTSPRLFAAALLLELSALLLLSRYGDFAVAGNAVAFAGCGLIAGGFYLLAVASFESITAVRRPKVLWVAAILLRVAVLWIEPDAAFHDAAAREGEHQLRGGNPYLPGAPPTMREASYPALFGPGAEMILWGLARVGAGPWGYKLLLVVADLLTVFLLLRLNTGAGRYRRIAWYAWNPLVIYAFAGGAHLDSLMILTLVAATWALHRSNPLDTQRPSWTWAGVSAAFLGLSISVFAMPLLLLPVWVAALRWRSVVLLLALAVPAALAQWYGGVQTVMHPVLSLWETTSFNSPVFGYGYSPLLAAQFGPGYQTLLLAAAAAVLAFLHRDDWRRALIWVLGAILILTPIFEPWYAIWILPFAGWRRHYAWYVLSLTVIASFLFRAPNPDFNYGHLLRFTIFVFPLLIWWFFERRPRETAEA